MNVSTNSPLSEGTNGDYSTLYGYALEALKLNPQDNRFAADTYVVCILLHDKLPSTCQPATDFLLLKVKGKHTVEKIRKAYHKQIGVEVNLKVAECPIPDTTQVHQLELDDSSDKIVVLTSHQVVVDQTTLSSNSSSQNKEPLASLKSPPQNVPKGPAINDSIKLEDFQASESLENERLANEHPVPDVVGDVRITRPSYLAPTRDKNGNGISRWTSPYIPPNVRSDLYHGESSKGNEFSGFAGFSHPLSQSSSSTPVVKTEDPSSNSAAENEREDESTSMVDFQGPSEPLEPSPALTGDQGNTRLQRLIEKGSPEQLEDEVKKSRKLLEKLKASLVGMVSQHRDAQYFTQQIQMLQDHKVETPTIIGVVGSTGAGKSSVINALLEEERLVPTNCMRACTAVVTEISWNSSDDTQARYRAEVEFIQATDWETDLKVTLTELMDINGNVSRECANADSEAGIAYAKIKAVYPQKTKEQLASSTIQELMNEPSLKQVLGTTKKIEQPRPEPFYKALQHFVDSKEKATTSEIKKKKEKGEKTQMEFWPLIKVVRIYTKAYALSTGAVIVDLPGVHDSNAARAAVASEYMKQCTGLWIVAPINRAVDDKAAKSLLGESFKRQLKYDGTYSRITFICSKTDDISIMEASESLGLQEEMAADWEKIDQIEKEKRILKEKLKELEDSRVIYTDIVDESDLAIEVWDQLKDDLENGKDIFVISHNSNKRKRSAEERQARKKSKKHKAIKDEDDTIVENDDSDNAEEDDEGKEANSDSESASEMGDPLTLDTIEEKLLELKEDKKGARKERARVDDEIKTTNQDIESLKTNQIEIEARMSMICIQGRNAYSKSAIQQDFAAGIKELDMENAQEQEDFNPEEADNLRDYDEVARSLPVFCVSSRAAQKLAGRLQRDSDVTGFQSLDETEIPQLRQHCKLLTEAGRASNCRRFLTNVSQLLTSLGIWASNDGSGLNLSDSQMAAETQFLKSRLTALEESLEIAVHECLEEINKALAENIFDKYQHVVQLAIHEAGPEVQRWHAPVNRDNRPAGGYHWTTYKAIMRRAGVYANYQGKHDFNAKLAEPIVKNLAGHWERVFAQRLPRALQNFSGNLKLLLADFHCQIEAHSAQRGDGVAGSTMLGQQLRNYEAIFQTLAAEMGDLINNLQREANREFTPAIARNLSIAYEWCADESGGGCFARMKKYMADHIDISKSGMFKESCAEVRTRLNHMVSAVEKAMASKAEEVFVRMSRDYNEIVAGKNTLQIAERQMRAQVAAAIVGREEASWLVEVDDAEGAVDEAKTPGGVAPASPDEEYDAARQLKVEAVQDDAGHTLPFLPPADVDN